MVEGKTQPVSRPHQDVYRGRPEDLDRNNGIAAMLRAGQS